ncbi:hypothetical protein GCM10010168_45320 [Actinoplanes ianthinogenes]|uniref:Uncharacterized protein n=1 Tax=Actinoplanes ianthinogenes TaxID=122358 RepID=A0ABM7LPN6_9ACTN|nr:hypothetical protein [Actinoplanes ianthinogenes]BCJ41170.1 hypothetical protein Aiant_18270 [Actinoplanes ianthinogenes]GGR22438.1 hypothetical protein GCM10010168_45320 [Actinoplanes ianthinogenes]
MADAELVDRLIAEVAHAPDWRRHHARPGHLPIFNNWGPVSYLTSTGDVVLNDEEAGPLRAADAAERDFALARAAELYAELAHLRPARPRTAVTCDLCRGSGRLATSPEGPRSFVYCPPCNSLGWTSPIADRTEAGCGPRV